MPFVNTTFLQRTLTAIALDVAEKAAKDAMSAHRRLELPETAAEQLLGSLQYVRNALNKILPAQQGEERVDNLTPTAMKAWRIALATWIRVVTKRAEADKQKGLNTNLFELSKAAQGVLDQLHEQLSLPIVDIGAFVEVAAEEKEDDTSGVSPAPHRGKRTDRATAKTEPADPRSARGPKLVSSGRDRAAGKEPLEDAPPPKAAAVTSLAVLADEEEPA